MTDSEQHALQERTDRLHALLLEALNEPEDRWSEQPIAAAAVLASVLANVLRQVAAVDPNRLPEIRGLLVGVADHVTSACVVVTGPTH